MNGENLVKLKLNFLN